MMDVAELLIYEDIGGWWGITAAELERELRRVEVQEITVRINSYGGEAFEGIAIHNLLTRHDARVVVHVDGIAASAASIISMAGDEIHMAANAMMMIHEAWGMTQGPAEDHEKHAAMLRKLNRASGETYAGRTQREIEDVLKLMADETWMTAQDALAMGFATHVTPAKSGDDSESALEAMVAAASMSHVANGFRHAPAPLQRMLTRAHHPKQTRAGASLIHKASQPPKTARELQRTALGGLACGFAARIGDP